MILGDPNRPVREQGVTDGVRLGLFHKRLVVTTGLPYEFPP
jgi:hypothetical protein